MKNLSSLLASIVIFCSFATAQQAGSRAEAFLRKAAHTYLPDSTLYYANEALLISAKNGLPAYKQKALYQLGKGYIAIADYGRAEKMFVQGMAIADSLGDNLYKGLFVLETGKVMQLTHRHEDALRLYIDAYKLFEAAGSREGLVRADVTLAEYYRNLGKYEDATVSIHNAFIKAKGLELDEPLSILMNNRAAAIKSETNDLDSALYYSNLALSTSIEKGNLHYKAVSLNEIGFILEKKNQYPEAETHYREAEEIWESTGHKRYWSNALHNRARVLIRMGQRELSNRLLHELVAEIKDKEWYGTLASAYGMMADNYYHMGDFKNAADNRDLQRITAELQFKEEHGKEVEEIKTKYETEKNKNLLQEKMKEVEKANLRMHAQEIETRGLLFGSAVLVFALLIGMFFYRQRSRINRELTVKNSQIEEVNHKLSASVKQTETLMKEVHHRVKNNLQIISSMLHLQASSIANEELKALLKESDNRILLMAYLHERLYRQNDLERLSAKEFVESITGNIVQSFAPFSSSIDLVNEIEDIPMKMDKAVVTGIIVNELVTNSIKYAFPNIVAEKQIRIRLFMQQDKMNLHVTDNGIGLPVNFDVEASPSFGLKLVTIMVEQAEGKMAMKSEGGAKFLIEM